MGNHLDKTSFETPMTKVKLKIKYKPKKEKEKKVMKVDIQYFTAKTKPCWIYNCPRVNKIS